MGRQYPDKWFGRRLMQRTFLALTAMLSPAAFAQLPQFDHIVVVIEENHNFGEIIGSSFAPYINTLAASSALFMSSHGTEHPSQPNYLDLYSGFNQGLI